LEQETKAKLYKILTPQQQKVLEATRPPLPGGPGGPGDRPFGPGGRGPRANAQAPPFPEE
jgi:hypothetical protein